MRQIFYAAALAFTVSCADASTIEFATCEDPALQIVPTDWQEFDAAGPIVRIPPFLAGNPQRQTDLIREGKLFVDRRGEVIDLDAVDWVANNHNYVSSQLHGLVSIGGLLRDDRKLPGDIEEAVAKHILNWAHCVVNNREHGNRRAWNEGAVIKRQSNLLQILNYAREYGDLPHLDRRTLLYLIDVNALFLLDEPGIYQMNNHGIRQDMLLAATAISLPEHPRSGEMFALAEERLNEVGRVLFTDEGVFLEHAPGYVHYVLRLMKDVTDLDEASDSFGPRLFTERYYSSLDYLMSSLMPDGGVPFIGRSANDRVSERVASEEEIEQALAERARSLRSYPGYGHAIVRGDHPDGLYLIFVAAQNLPAPKRDSADLSFLLVNHGRMWITEGGHVTYRPTPERDYTLSPLAHNTYILNDRFLPPDTNRGLVNRLTRAEQDDDGFSIAGFSDRLHGRSTFERAIHIDDDFGAVEIRDVLASEVVERWQGRFQIPGDLEVSIEGDTVTATDPASDHQMVMEFSSDAALSFSTCKGEEKPLCGWGQNPDGYGPVTTVMWSLTENAEIEIDISWR